MPFSTKEFQNLEDHAREAENVLQELYDPVAQPLPEDSTHYWNEYLLHNSFWENNLLPPNCAGIILESGEELLNPNYDPEDEIYTLEKLISFFEVQAKRNGWRFSVSRKREAE